MNQKLILSGFLLGIVATFALFANTGISGFSVAVGEQTQNLNINLTGSGVVPLTLPNQLTSLTLDGRYTGSGSVNVQLVGPNGSWHVASYTAPATPSNASFLLNKGGTVVRLGTGTNLTYTHILDQECDQTCNQTMEGPFYLQVSVTGGNFTLSSIHYVSPQLINTPQTPTNGTINTTINNTAGAYQHVNIPSDCHVDSDCAAGDMCHVGYCISQTGHLNITDHNGRLVALFDKHGRVLLAGDIHVNATGPAPGNAFTVHTANGDTAWITDTGDLYLEGTPHEEANQIPLSGSQNLIIRNTTENVCVIQGDTGDLYTRNVIVTGVLP